ncbi:DUF1254 domain-containing protein [Agromyces sp. GXQ0307]|uniref:DUF1254 domain-containing protein n=1 Tax=Agromyces sp. GXQ0307 TaxID=3377835 RepID=UPI00383ADF7C
MTTNDQHGTDAFRDSISTPDHVESRIGRLEFVDGAPTAETAGRVYDHLDFVYGVQAFLSGYPGASMHAIHRGLRSIGVEDHSVLLFSELMDSQSVFLTANCDTVYALSFLDLTDGPMILDVPRMPEGSAILGTIDDLWFRWVTDVGVPGPDRGTGGRYLIVGPGHDGVLPDSGFHVSHARTTHVIALLRAFMIDGDPERPAAAIREGLRISPYRPGGAGTSVATFLGGGAPLTPVEPPTETTFVEGSGVAFNTVPPNDASYWEHMHDFIQSQPSGAGDPDVLGLFAALGISKGSPFAPDERMRRVLDEAVAVGNATARTVSFAPREEEGFAYYEGSQWMNMLFLGGYEFLAPPPEITPEGVVAVPDDGARKLNARIAFFYPYTGITPAMCMRLTGIGSQYLIAVRDADGEYLDGSRTYRLTLPAGIPQARFWSIMIYDRQTRSMLQTGQRYPDIGSQVGDVREEEDGSTVIHLGPDEPEGRASNWLQTDPSRGFFAILRFYSPTAAFFDKSWRAGEITRVE